MTLANLCLILGALFSFGMLILKIIEVARIKYGAGRGSGCNPSLKREKPRPLQRPGLQEGAYDIAAIYMTRRA